MERQRIGARSLVRLLGSWNNGPTAGATYRQLADALGLLILDGRLALGARLAGERELAGALSVSRTTVAAAYHQLRERGFLASRQGSGHVTRLPAGPGIRATGLVAPDLDSRIIDLAAASLAAPEGLHAAYQRALAMLPEYMPRDGYEPVGLVSLRSMIADRYVRRGLPTQPEQIMVTMGAQHGFALVLRALAGPGDRVIIDHPTYPHALDAIERASCTPVPVALPPVGWDLDAFQAAARYTAPRLVYLIADFHNPTGRVMDAPTRSAWAEIARSAGSMLVVDETMVDIWLDEPPPPPVAAFGGEDAIITLGSTGKAFWGGVRVGWVRADPRIIDSLARVRISMDLGTPILEQLATLDLLANDESLLEARRAQLRAGHKLVIDTLAERLSTWKVQPAAGGVSVWAEMPLPLSAPLTIAAETLDVRIVPGSRFGVGGAFERFLRVPFTQPEERLRTGLARLAQAYDQLRPVNVGTPDFRRAALV